MVKKVPGNLPQPRIIFWGTFFVQLKRIVVDGFYLG
jgi:hypothetical protein